MEQSKTRYYTRNSNIFLDSEVEIYVNRFQENFRSVQHTHEFMEINYVSEGRGFQYIDDKVISVASGDIFIIPKGTAHVYRPSAPKDAQNLIVYNCVFPVENLMEWCCTIPLPFHPAEIFSRSDRNYYHYHDIGNEVKDIFERLYNEFIQLRKGYRTLLILYVVELVVSLYRFENKEIALERLDPADRLEQVMVYIHENYHQPLSLSQMAEMVFMSTSHFQRLFKQCTGQTFIHMTENTPILYRWGGESVGFNFSIFPHVPLVPTSSYPYNISMGVRTNVRNQTNLDSAWTSFVSIHQAVS